MGEIGLPELILIFVVGLVVFGPGRLPDLGRSVGKALREFRQAMRSEGEDTAESSRPKQLRDRGP